MAADTTGVTEPVAVAAGGAIALVTGWSALEAVDSAGARALAGSAALVVAAVDGAELPGLGSVPASAAAVVSCAAEVAVEVTAELTAAAADVVVEVAVLVTGLEVGGGVVAALAGVVAGAEVVAGAVVEVAVDVTEVAVDVTEEVVEVTAEPGAMAVAGAVAACACRENTSKTTRIPAASIAHCAARRAARRKASCGIGSSPQGRLGPDTTAHL